MKIYKIYDVFGLSYVYSMNPVEGELTDEVKIQLPQGYREIRRENGERGIACPDGCVATMFFGPDPTIYEYTEERKGEYRSFQICPAAIH